MPLLLSDPGLLPKLVVNGSAVFGTFNNPMFQVLGERDAKNSNCSRLGAVVAFNGVAL